MLLSVLGAEYSSPKKVNLSNMVGLYKPKKVKGYLLSPLGVGNEPPSTKPCSSHRVAAVSVLRRKFHHVHGLIWRLGGGLYDIYIYICVRQPLGIPPQQIQADN